MPKREHVVAVVREWVVKAENDLKTARHTLLLADDCPTDTVCFHSQQCIEKYLKAFLVLKQIPFPKTHDLSELLNMLPSEFQNLLSQEEQELFTDYAVVTRYPSAYGEISLSDARKSVRVAVRIRRAVRTVLPKEAFPATKKKNQRDNKNGTLV